MVEFKLGCKVKLLRDTQNDTNRDLEKGDIGTITDIVTFSYSPSLITIENEKGKTSIEEDGLELITKITNWRGEFE